MKIIGHRGAAGLKAENTIPSIKKAVDLHVDEVEIDVRVTKDNVAVVVHDEHLERIAGYPATVAQFSYNNLKAIKPDLPTLSEAIIVVNKLVPLMIEVKPDVDCAPVVTTIKQFLADGWQPSHFLLSSFSYTTLKTLQAALPDISIVVLDKWSGVRASHHARKLGTKRISMYQRWLWTGLIKAMAGNGYQLCAYTVNDPRQASRWEKAGLYGIITDYPDRY